MDTCAQEGRWVNWDGFTENSLQQANKMFVVKGNIYDKGVLQIQGRMMKNIFQKVLSNIENNLNYGNK